MHKTFSLVLYIVYTQIHIEVLLYIKCDGSCNFCSRLSFEVPYTPHKHRIIRKYVHKHSELRYGGLSSFVFGHNAVYIPDIFNDVPVNHKSSPPPSCRTLLPQHQLKLVVDFAEAVANDDPPPRKYIMSGLPHQPKVQRVPSKDPPAAPFGPLLLLLAGTHLTSFCAAWRNVNVSPARSRGENKQRTRVDIVHGNVTVTPIGLAGRREYSVSYMRF